VKKVVPATGETTLFVYDASGRMVAEYSTIVTPPSEAKVSYLTTDNLGSPRVITDQNGQVTSRRDFMPFGEEINSGTGGRTTAQGYFGVDSIRQKFTGYERDAETDLDFAQARYYKSAHGRFTSVDPVFVSIKRLIDPQRLNLYSYSRSNPLRFIDPSGEDLEIKAKNEEEAQKRLELLKRGLLEKDRSKVKLVVGDGKNGFAKGVFGVVVDQKHKSDSKNFQMLQKISGDKNATVELQFLKKGEAVPAYYAEMKGKTAVLVSFKERTGVDFTLGEQEGFDVRGWTTYPLDNPPSDFDYPIYSNDQKTRANIYEEQTELEIVVTMFHELAAHVYLSNVGREPPKGAHGRNEVEKEVKRAEAEATANFNSTKKK
jgi:RHS repeat-associated protein